MSSSLGCPPALSSALSQHYTSLKGRSGRVQAVVIGGQATFVIVIALVVAWFSASRV